MGHHQTRRFLAFLIPLLLLATLAFAPSVEAHAELVKADPAVNGLVAASPAQLHLWFSESLVFNDRTPTVQVLDDKGREIKVTKVSVDPNNDREMIVDLPSFGPGTYTVKWTNQSKDDGHVLSGAYAFRVGGGLPAGAATTVGQTPAAWAVALRWLTYLGAALALGGFFFTLIVLPGGAASTAGNRRRNIAILAGAAVALVATVLEPVLQTFFPPEGLTGGFLDLVRGQPTAWWLRPGALIPLVILAIVLVGPLRGRLPQPLAWLGAALAAIAILGLALTSHASGRATWRDVAVLVDVLHQWSTALWVGGLAHLALWWPARAAAEGETPAETLPLRRFSAIALGLFAVAVASGVGNAAFILPALSSLWSSDYGYVLIAKGVVLLIPFGLAAYHHRTISRAVGTALHALHRTVRVEAIVVLAVVLGGSVLALSAPPVISKAPLDNVQLVEPVLDAQGNTQANIHLTVDPAKPGTNAVDLRVTDQNGKPVPADKMRRLWADFASLSYGTVRDNVEATADPAKPDSYAINGLDLSLEGWWRVTAHVMMSDFSTMSADFYLMLPDPNVNGFDAPPKPKNDPEAQALYEHALKQLASLHSLKFTQAIGSGQDVLVTAHLAITIDPKTGQTTASSLDSPNYHSISVGQKSWLKQEGGGWLEQPSNLLPPLSSWVDTYGGGTNVRFGIKEMMGGEEAQIVTFYLPEKPSQAEAWFAWWIGTKTGRLYQMTMTADQHYMVETHSDFNGNFTISPPPGAAFHSGPDLRAVRPSAVGRG
jgi:copper transport protein